MSKPIGGRLIHGTAEIEGYDVELYHAVFIDGKRVYQVLAFSEKKFFAEMQRRARPGDPDDAATLI